MTASLKAGDLVAGKYVIERVIGRGGLGVVMSAQHTVLRQRVALKFLRPEFVSEPEAAGRFLREARAAAQMRGEHVARVMDAGTLETGEAFLAMEYLEGRDLAAALARDGPLPVDDAVDYLLQACEAVAEAHALGIVHRDLKPANLFLTSAPDGSAFVKVLDFGLSKLAAGESRASLTADHQVLGSPHFMSPEQMRSSRDVDARSDVWALGAVLFTLLAGAYPFEGRLLTEICAAVLGGDRRRLRDLRPDVPAELEALVARCLSTAPEGRFESVASLALALEPFAPHRARPRVERVGRVLEARASARASTPPPSWSASGPGAVAVPFGAATPAGPAGRPSSLPPAGLVRSSSHPLPLLKPAVPAFDSAPAPSWGPAAGAPSWGPAAGAPPSARPSSVPPWGAESFASQPARSTDRPPWAQTSPPAEVATSAAVGRSGSRFSPTVTLGAFAALGLALAAWGAWRAGGSGAPPASPPSTTPTSTVAAPQSVVAPLSASAPQGVDARSAAPAEPLAGPIADLPPKRPANAPAAEHAAPAGAGSVPPEGVLRGFPRPPSPGGAPMAPSATPFPPRSAAQHVPSSSPSSRPPAGALSDEELIKSLPH